jgi:GABA permease
LLLTITNLASVGNYGEFEFWFALIKVVAIVAFIGIGVAAIFGLIPDSEVSGVQHLRQPDGLAPNGFAPNGFGAIIAAMLITMFSFMGTEIVTIAAESPNPSAGISKAVNSVIWRISLFYIGSIFVIVALMPYDQLEDGSYQSTLEAIGIPGSRLNHGSGDPHRGGLVPEFGALHGVPDVVLPGRAQRRATGGAQFDR